MMALSCEQDVRALPDQTQWDRAGQNDWDQAPDHPNQGWTTHDWQGDLQKGWRDLAQSLVPGRIHPLTPGIVAREAFVGLAGAGPWQAVVVFSQTVLTALKNRQKLTEPGSDFPVAEPTGFCPPVICPPLLRVSSLLNTGPNNGAGPLLDPNCHLMATGQEIATEQAGGARADPGPLVVTSQAPADLAMEGPDMGVQIALVLAFLTQTVQEDPSLSNLPGGQPPSSALLVALARELVLVEARLVQLGMTPQDLANRLMEPTCKKDHHSGPPRALPLADLFHPSFLQGSTLRLVRRWLLSAQHVRQLAQRPAPGFQADREMFAWLDRLIRDQDPSRQASGPTWDLTTGPFDAPDLPCPVLILGAPTIVRDRQWCQQALEAGIATAVVPTNTYPLGAASFQEKPFAASHCGPPPLTQDLAHRLAAPPALATHLPKDPKKPEDGPKPAGQAGPQRFHLPCPTPLAGAKTALDHILDLWHAQPRGRVGLIGCQAPFLQALADLLRRQGIRSQGGRPSLLSSLLTLVWTGSRQGWTLDRLIALGQHPLVLRAHPLASAMAGWIKRHPDRLLPPGTSRILLQDICLVSLVHASSAPRHWPRWLAKALKTLEASFQGLATLHLGPCTHWVKAHLEATQTLVPKLLWDDDRAQECLMGPGTDPSLAPPPPLSQPSLHTTTPLWQAETYRSWLDWALKARPNPVRFEDPRLIVAPAAETPYLDLDLLITQPAQPTQLISWLSLATQQSLGLVAPPDPLIESAPQVLCLDPALPAQEPVRPAQRPSIGLPNQPLGPGTLAAAQLLSRAPSPQRPAPASSGFENSGTPGLPPHLRVSLSDLQLWRRDPRDFVVRKIARIQPAPSDHSLWGAGIHRWLAQTMQAYPPSQGAQEKTLAAVALDLASETLPLTSWLDLARVQNLCQQIAHQECLRRTALGPYTTFTALHGQIEVATPQGPVQLVGQIDRLDLFPDGSCHILDYTSGTLPAFVDLGRFLSVQMPLQALMVTRGAFGRLNAHQMQSHQDPRQIWVAQFQWWKISRTSGLTCKAYPKHPEPRPAPEIRQELGSRAEAKVSPIEADPLTGVGGTSQRATGWPENAVAPTGAPKAAGKKGACDRSRKIADLITSYEHILPDWLSQLVDGGYTL